ncbi:MAG: selenide, water dikinase SelD [Gammaproteobacteria bacterium]|nr:selenide, water dikinase SelD [Gammaproteobacteria bacterium]
MTQPIKLTQYSHGAGCGCKISPKVLDTILKTQIATFDDPNLIVGNHSKDDAAVVDIGNGTGIISTTDFFMPIVDDPFTFGRIAATNAISDIYAMGGTPITAIAILGWPINLLAPEVAQQVIDGGRSVCHEAGISLAGGHSIDSPEPIFGLAVTGIIPLDKLKQNNTATAGCQLYLTKPLGIGILTTAQKQQKLSEQHQNIAIDAMCKLNKIGAELSQIVGVEALTDVTGFGLVGHLSEICLGSGVKAQVNFSQLPLLDQVENYRNQGCIPGGTHRNYESYQHLINEISEQQKHIVCDPQTSGGLLVAVQPQSAQAVAELLAAAGLHAQPIGQLVANDQQSAVVEISE